MAFGKTLHHAHVSKQGFSRCGGNGNQGVLAREDGGNGGCLWRMEPLNAPFLFEKGGEPWRQIKGRNRTILLLHTGTYSAAVQKDNALIPLPTLTSPTCPWSKHDR